MQKRNAKNNHEDSINYYPPMVGKRKQTGDEPETKKKKDVFVATKVVCVNFFKDMMKEAIFKKFNSRAIVKSIKDCVFIDVFKKFKDYYGYDEKGSPLVRDSINDKDVEARQKKVENLRKKCMDYADLFLAENKKLFEEVTKDLDEHKSAKFEIDNYSKKSYKDYEFKEPFEMDHEEKEMDQKEIDDDFSKFLNQEDPKPTPISIIDDISIIEKNLKEKITLKLKIKKDLKKNLTKLTIKQISWRIKTNN